MLKRFVDIILSVFGLLIFAAPLLFIAIAVRVTSKGPVIHWSKRIGRNNKLFLMPKFRTMKVDTPQVATHLLTNADSYLTSVGSFLRKTSLDEIPQLLSVFLGDMSFVGPRPALFSQDDLVSLRTQLGIERLRPGITGWAQINGRDELPIPVKVELDRFYLENQSLLLDFKILFITVFKVLRSEGVQH